MRKQLTGAACAFDACLTLCMFDWGGYNTLLSIRQSLCVLYVQANDLRKRADGTSSNIADLERRMNRDALSGTRSTDHYAMARLQQEDLRRKIAADKTELQKLMPPVAPVAPSAAAAASTGRTTPGPGSAGGLTGQQALQAAAAAAARGSAAGRGQQPMLAQVGMQQQLALLLLQQQQQINQLPIQQRVALQQQLALQGQLQQQGQLPPGAQQAYLQALQQQALQQQQQQQQQLLVQIAQQQAQQRQQQQAQQRKQ
jgi:hypothetical protein